MTQYRLQRKAEKLPKECFELFVFFDLVKAVQHTDLILCSELLRHKQVVTASML